MKYKWSRLLLFPMVIGLMDLQYRPLPEGDDYPDDENQNKIVRRKNTMANTNAATKVITGKARLSYCNLFQPRAAEEGQDAKYSCTILLPKSDKETAARIKAAIEAAKVAGVDLLKDKNGKMPATVKTPIHDGDGEKPNGGECGEECKGHYVINASSKTKPGVVDKNCNEILNSTEIYSGCYGRVSINFYAFNTKGNKGIAAGLNNVQKLADGDYLGGRSRAEDDFEPVADEDDGLLG